jgi:competence protein ComEA
LNLNTASAIELQRIKGIGPKLASAIIKFRKENGPFKQLSHLKRIKGIGDKKMKTFAPFLKVD